MACVLALLALVASCSKYGSDFIGFNGRTTARTYAKQFRKLTVPMEGAALIPAPTLPPDEKGYHYQFYDYSLNSHNPK